MFDLDYVVNRPESEEPEGPECEDDGTGEGDCSEKRGDRTPYKKYKGYKNWKRRPLLVIIIGGLRWDYLTPSW